MCFCHDKNLPLGRGGIDGGSSGPQAGGAEALFFRKKRESPEGRLGRRATRAAIRWASVGEQRDPER